MVHPEINDAVVIVLLALFSLYCLYYIRKIGRSISREPVFERSEILMILANLTNSAESILNILSTLNGGDIFIITGISNYVTRFYAACMGMRIYRLR